MKTATRHGTTRLPQFLAIALTCTSGAAAESNSPDLSTTPTFSGPNLVEVGTSFDLKVQSNQPDQKNWIVRWGDGVTTTEGASVTSLHHIYQKPGLYKVDVGGATADGMQIPALLDYSQLILDDAPMAYFRFGTAITGHSATSPPLCDDSLNAPPQSELSGLPWGAQAASFDQWISPLCPSLATPHDRFSVDFWFRLHDFVARQDLLTSSPDTGTQLYFADGKIILELPKGARFAQALPPSARAGEWHHLAISYDRTVLFPYQNVARFYLDGTLQGEQHLDVYDTGAVSFPGGVIGSTSGDLHRFKGDVAELALYDHLLAPHRILEHIKPYFNPHTASIMAAARCVEPFTVQAPRRSQTIKVSLDPRPGVDNAPVLRAAIHDAAPGTRLSIINQTTNKTGGDFYFNSLDEGHDWSVFRIVGKNDFEIDGGGATFVFGTDNRQFFLRDSNHIALRNFSVDLDQTKYRVGVYARILDLNTETGDIRFQFVNGRDKSPDMGVPTTVSMWRWRPHDPKTLRLTKGPFFQTDQAFLERPQRDPDNASILVGRLKPGLITELEDYREGTNFFMVNNAHFENTSVSMEQCEHVTFDRVNFYATLGMVFLSGEENHIHVTNCKIGLPPGLTAADRPLASGADGYHFHDTQGYVLFDNNEIALTDDDPITIKDGVYRDVTGVDNDTLALNGNFRIGDEMELYRGDFSPLDYRGHIVSLSHGNAQMDRPLPPGLPKTFIALNLRHHTNNWIIRDSSLHDYYGRLLLCTAHGLITGNVVEHSWLHLGASDAPFDSSGISSAVTVYNNLLLDTSADTGIWGWSSAYPVFQEITFYQNSFVGENLRLGNAGRPWVVDNYFETRAHPDMKSDDARAAIQIDQTESPTILGNTQLTGQPGDFNLITNATTDLTTDANITLVSPAQSTATY